MLSIKKLLTEIISDGKTKNSTLTINKGTAGQNWCKKKCGVVEFYVEASGISWGTGWNTIATLPSGYGPPLYYDFVAKDNTNDTACSCKITAGGEVQVYKTNAVSNHVRIHGIHFAGGGYSLTALFRVFSRLAERWWEYAEHEENAYKTIKASELPSNLHKQIKCFSSGKQLHFRNSACAIKRNTDSGNGIYDNGNGKHKHKCLRNIFKWRCSYTLLKEYCKFRSHRYSNRIYARSGLAVSERGCVAC